jgi:hypothetical protein
MGFASFDELKTAILRETIRTGDASFDADFPRQVQFAEQRINYGGGAPLYSPPLRIRGMEKTVKLNLTAGKATLPGNYLAPKRLTFDSDLRVPLTYRTPQEFWDGYLTNGCGIPYTYTVEGDTLTVSPSAAGSLTFTYFAKFEAVQTEDAVTDRTGSGVLTRAGELVTQRTTAQSNWLMENAPSVIFYAVLIESVKFLRQTARIQEMFAEYVSAIGGLNLTEAKARTPTTLAPRIRGARIPS